MTLDTAPQVPFAAEFALFLVAMAGLALVVLRAELLTRTTASRALLAVGFTALGGAAFAHGSLLVDDTASPGLAAARTGGWLAVALATRAWVGGASARSTVVAGVVLGLGSAAAAAFDADVASVVLQSIAVVAIGGALLAASRRAIAARVAASAAATLLLVVLVLSVGLSAVLSNNVEDQAVASLDARAEREANAIEVATRQLLEHANLAVSAMADADLLSDLADGGGPEERAAVQAFLGSYADRVFDALGLAYVDSREGVVAAIGLTSDDPSTLLASEPVQEVLRTQSARGSVVVVADKAFAVGVAPVVLTLPNGSQAVAAVLATTALDEAYLAERSAADERVALALHSAGGVIAASGGEFPDADVVQGLKALVLGGSRRAVEVADGRFAAAKGVRNGDRPVAALIASRPTTAIDEIRENLFRTFFVIAFGGTLLALLLAALVGDRIGAGVRRLTGAAEALQQGEAGVRSGVRSEDEVGRLGAAFDAMAESIEEKTGALLHARNRVEAIVAGMGEALVAVDDECRITDVNEAAEDVLGITADDVMGKAFGEVVDAVTDDGASVATLLVTRHESRWSELGEVAVDGSAEPVPVAITAGALRGPAGEVTGRVLVLRDLRGEREVERMKREFLSRVGHELRTPLTPLLGYARILAGREVPPDKARVISQSMVESGRRLERIVELLEFFASAQAGRTIIRAEPVDVRGILTEAVAAHAAVAPSHKITRRVTTGTPRVHADGYWLRRTVDELLDNAIKFSPGGGRIAVTAMPTDDGFVEIAVRDSGVGMSEEEVEHAFAEWSQGDESDTRAYGGLGLGLALVQRVAERHGGSVRCETAPGKGSTFAVLVPAAVPVRRGERP